MHRLQGKIDSEILPIMNQYFQAINKIHVSNMSQEIRQLMMDPVASIREAYQLPSKAHNDEADLVEINRRNKILASVEAFWYT